MAVRIRLRRMGRKKKPHYRVVVTDRAAPREGRFVETLGYYRPLLSPARLVLDLERVDFWIDQGALPSQTVNSLITRARKGGDDTLAVGDVDVEAMRATKAEALAAKRKAEVEAVAQKAEARVQKAAVEEAPEGEEAEPAVDPDADTVEVVVASGAEEADDAEADEAEAESEDEEKE